MHVRVGKIAESQFRQLTQGLFQGCSHSLTAATALATVVTTRLREQLPEATMTTYVEDRKITPKRHTNIAGESAEKAKAALQK